MFKKIVSNAYLTRTPLAPKFSLVNVALSHPQVKVSGMSDILVATQWVYSQTRKADGPDPSYRGLRDVCVGGGKGTPPGGGG
jgi:hypothetical protein